MKCIPSVDVPGVAAVITTTIRAGTTTGTAIGIPTETHTTIAWPIAPIGTGTHIGLVVGSAVAGVVTTARARHSSSGQTPSCRPGVVRTGDTTGIGVVSQMATTPGVVTADTTAPLTVATTVVTTVPMVVRGRSTVVEARAWPLAARPPSLGTVPATRRAQGREPHAPQYGARRLGTPRVRRMLRLVRALMVGAPRVLLGRTHAPGTVVLVRQRAGLR
jgi:hypothetical protein